MTEKQKGILAFAIFAVVSGVVGITITEVLMRVDYARRTRISQEESSWKILEANIRETQELTREELTKQKDFLDRKAAESRKILEDVGYRQIIAESFPDDSMQKDAVEKIKKDWDDPNHVWEL